MPRTFDAVDDKITLALGALGFAAGPITIAAIVKKGANGTQRSVLHAGTDSGSTRFGMGTDASDQVHLRISGNILVSSSVKLVALDGWALIAATKATGTVAARLHNYIYGTNTHTHANSAGTSGAGTPTTNAYIGSTAGAAVELWNGDIALVAVWAEQLGDAIVESLPFSLQPWFRPTLKGLWLLDQAATGQLVPDLSGLGANESSKVGTAVGSSSVPRFSYGHVIRATRQPAAGGVARDLAVGIAGVGTVAPKLVRATALKATLAGVGAVSPKLVRQTDLKVAVAGTGAVAPKLVRQTALATAISGVGALTARLNEAVALRLAAAGTAAVSATLSLGAGAVALLERMKTGAGQ